MKKLVFALLLVVAFGNVAEARPARWCGWYMGQHTGLTDRSLWKASNWANVGSNAGGPRVGAIVVWRHHVGKITGQTNDGRWIVLSGNDGHAVRERPRNVAGAIAFRIVDGINYAGQSTANGIKSGANATGNFFSNLFGMNTPTEIRSRKSTRNRR